MPSAESKESSHGQWQNAPKKPGLATLDFLTYLRAFLTIRASSAFPGSSVVERRTVNPLVGGSNPSRGASKINSLRFFPVDLLHYSSVGN
jgi:hypothetical protein